MVGSQRGPVRGQLRAGGGAEPRSGPRRWWRGDETPRRASRACVVGLMARNSRRRRGRGRGDSLVDLQLQAKATASRIISPRLVFQLNCVLVLGHAPSPPRLRPLEAGTGSGAPLGPGQLQPPASTRLQRSSWPISGARTGISVAHVARG